jgi:hypothetical protein
LVHLRRIAVGELSVAVETAHAEVDVAVRLIGVAALDQGLDQQDDLRDGPRGERLRVGPAEAERVGVGDVRGGHLVCVLGRRLPRLAGGVVDLVVDVGDVDDQLRIEPLVDQEALQQGEDDERPGVADVDAPVDRRAAGVDPHLAGLARLELANLAAERVVDANRHHARMLLGRKRAYSVHRAGMTPNQ